MAPSVKRRAAVIPLIMLLRPVLLYRSRMGIIVAVVRIRWVGFAPYRYSRHIEMADGSR